MLRISFISLFLILLIVILLVLVISRRADKKSGRLIIKLLNKIDKAYQSYIEQKENELILQSSDFEFDKEAIVNEAKVMLRPQTDSVISVINSAEGKQAEVKYEGGYFQNVASLSEHLLRKKSRSRHKVLTPEDEQAIINAFEDSIRADLAQRTFKLKTGGQS
ncbi:MAG: hypothetical protein U9N85_09660 [Bacteroidota bacterium]|nr:hypothetical protein [Bacteroidota bacterium]